MEKPRNIKHIHMLSGGGLKFLSSSSACALIGEDPKRESVARKERVDLALCRTIFLISVELPLSDPRWVCLEPDLRLGYIGTVA